jgi:Tfp pilus assembly protein PilV
VPEVKRRLRRIHAEQSGFTLPELLTSIFIGMIVIMAAFMLLDRAVTGSAQVADREDASQRGRVAMEQIATRLRSEVCLGTSQAIQSGDDNSVTFYANLSSNATSAQKRTLRYVASENKMYEDIYNGTGTFPALTFPASPSSTREIARPIQQATKKSGSTTTTLPIFRYYKYAPNTTNGSLTQLTTPLSANDAGDVVMIAVAFAALPLKKVQTSNDVKDASTYESQVFVRLADPGNPSEGPACL